MKAFIIIVVVVLSLALVLVRSVLDTSLLTQESFDGIRPLQKNTSSIIVIHGIGDHCIGYAEELISYLAKELSGDNASSIEDSYKKYLEHRAKDDDLQQVRRTQGGSYKVDAKYPLLDGNCTPRDSGRFNSNADVVIDTGEDVESVVLAQDALCEDINSVSEDSQWSCHKLYVNRIHKRTRKKTLSI